MFIKKKVYGRIPHNINKFCQNQKFILSTHHLHTAYFIKRTDLLSFLSALLDPPPQELGSFQQLLVFVSVHLPSPDLQHVFTAQRCGALAILQYRHS